jgi:RNA polymerase sigma-70 factor (ECF subfamily)
MAAEEGGAPRNFATTRWSLILTSADLGGEEQKAREALSELCRLYWRPIFSWPAERLFDLRWAATVVEQAVRRLREECESQGKLRAFEAMRSCLGAEREDVSYPTLSQTLGVPEATVKRLVHRLRQRYRTLLREEVAETVADPAEIDDEIRHLCGVLAAESAAV